MVSTVYVVDDQDEETRFTYVEARQALLSTKRSFALNRKLLLQLGGCITI
jgi:hypothetical protein